MGGREPLAQERDEQVVGNRRHWWAGVLGILAPGTSPARAPPRSRARFPETPSPSARAPQTTPTASAPLCRLLRAERRRVLFPVHLLHVCVQRLRVLLSGRCAACHPEGQAQRGGLPAPVSR